jgi:hypothetical protein
MKLVAYGADVEPKEIVQHLPILCKEKNIPCIEADKKQKEYGDGRRGKKLNLSDEARKKMKRFGKDNHFFGKSYEKIIIEKYGNEEGFKKIKEKKQNMNKRMSGINNPMYGKPSPEGSGNGWSGWYKGFYFRSLMELSFIKLMIDNDIKIKSGEKEIFSIKYYDVLNNKHKT